MLAHLLRRVKYVLNGGKERKSVRREKTQIGKVRRENPNHVPQDHPGCRTRTSLAVGRFEGGIG